MAKKNNKNIEENEFNYNLLKDKNIKKNLTQIENILGKANLNMYGTDRVSDVDTLNNQFQKLLHLEIDTITQKDNEDVTSFLSKLYSNDKKNNAYENILDQQFMSMTGDDGQSMQNFIYEAYRNRLLEQSDLHEVASQLIELSEAILIMRDAIVSADVVEGRMSRTLKFNKIDKEDSSDYIPIVESVEKRFKLLEKIKNFIIPKTLEYGEYYMYIIPYSKIFNDFMKQKDSLMHAGGIYHESTLYECVYEDSKNQEKKNKNNEWVDKLYTEYCISGNNENKKDEKPKKDEFVKDLNNIIKNITICNESVPIPILEEGAGSINYYMNEYVSESGDTYTEAKNKDNVSIDNLFKKTMSSDQGVYFNNKPNKNNDEFSDIKDCYIKLIEPTKIIPIKIMNQVVGYYYVQSEDITPLSGMISSTLYYSKFDETTRQYSIIDSIANKIVSSFNKKFLEDNIKFKETIVEAISYYNLNEKRLKFQFIPVEYIQPFKIDQDEEGNGQSMIKKSLFYAKLYLMLLLFKIMTIITNSNDQKVNYIKQSGIDKDVANKVQEIARIKQSRQVNIYDLFNYTTLINKVGNGSEMYVPVGRSGERSIETEILSGQDVQLNSDLLEMLKNSYILGTGVPAAIINYLNEADFAKIVEQNNTKFNGRVVNYQLDFNQYITEMYKKILKWSTNIPENVIDNFEFILQPPKTVTTNAKTESINAFNQLAEFVVGILYPSPDQSTDPELLNEQIRKFKKLYAQEQLPMLNMEKIEELFKQAEIETKSDSLKPDPINGDDGDDGLEEEIDSL